MYSCGRDIPYILQIRNLMNESHNWNLLASTTSLGCSSFPPHTFAWLFMDSRGRDITCILRMINLMSERDNWCMIFPHLHSFCHSRSDGFQVLRFCSRCLSSPHIDVILIKMKGKTGNFLPWKIVLSFYMLPNIQESIISWLEWIQRRIIQRG